MIPLYFIPAISRYCSYNLYWIYHDVLSYSSAKIISRNYSILYCDISEWKDCFAGRTLFQFSECCKTFGWYTISFWPPYRSWACKQSYSADKKRILEFTKIPLALLLFLVNNIALFLCKRSRPFIAFFLGSIS